MTKKTRIFIWLIKIIAAFIMLQSLYFKFSAHPEAVYIFTTLGMEPWGRIGLGVLELIASILILIPRTSWIGAVLALGLMSGAVFFHLTILGFVVYNDGGKLFIMAIIVILCSAIILWANRRRVPVLKKLVAG
ncbi:MAG: DoxX family protein [Chitinophagales bacterium]